MTRVFRDGGGWRAEIGGGNRSGDFAGDSLFPDAVPARLRFLSLVLSLSLALLATFVLHATMTYREVISMQRRVGKMKKGEVRTVREGIERSAPECSG